MDYIKRLKDVINKDTSLQDIVSCFEEMCSAPIDNGMILFKSELAMFKNLRGSFNEKKK